MRSRLKPKEIKWKYILMLRNGSAFFGDSLYQLFKEMFWAKWKRGIKWNE